MNVAQIHVKMVESVLMETICTGVSVLLVLMDTTVRVSFQYSVILNNAMDVIVTCRKTLFQQIK